MTGAERLLAAFASQKPLVTYLTAGDPDLGRTAELIEAVHAGGAGILELGVPFSDPSADGPPLQRAAERALASGTRLVDVLALARKAPLPTLLFGYLNPFLQYRSPADGARGLVALARDAAEAGIAGVLVVDLPPEEAGPLLAALRTYGLALIPLVTPVTPDERVRLAASNADAFLYYVSVTGVTGGALGDDRAALERVAAVRELAQKPLVVGFGVRTPADAARIGRVADGVVVGTALVALAHETGDPEAVRAAVAALRAAF